MQKETVYIAHPISGDVERNKQKVRMICRMLSLAGEVIPCAPYLEACEYLDDSILAERSVGIALSVGLFIRGAFAKVYLYGDCISSGMKAEVELAWDLGIPVLAKTEETEASLFWMILCCPSVYDPRNAVSRYLKRTGPIPLDDLRHWFWKQSPADAVVINKMIGERALCYHSGGLIGLA